MLDRIIISTNEDETYLDFWKIQKLANEIFFPNVKLTIAFLTHREENDSLVSLIKSKGIDVKLYKPLDGTPTANQAKILRYYCASEFNDEICLISDMDTIPLQAEYINKIISKRQKNILLGIGKEVLDGTPHSGKFPAHHICGEGKLFKEMYNPENLSFDECVKKYIGLKVFDHKEDINNPPHIFSDESLNRAVIYLNKINIQHIKREIDIHKQWIDRSWWFVDEQKLKNNFYIEANLLRPLKQNFQEIKKIITHLEKISDKKYEY